MRQGIIVGRIHESYKTFIHEACGLNNDEELCSQ